MKCRPQQRKPSRPTVARRSRKARTSEMGERRGSNESAAVQRQPIGTLPSQLTILTSWTKVPKSVRSVPSTALATHSQAARLPRQRRGTATGTSSPLNQVHLRKGTPPASDAKNHQLCYRRPGPGLVLKTFRRPVRRLVRSSAGAGQGAAHGRGRFQNQTRPRPDSTKGS